MFSRKSRMDRVGIITQYVLISFFIIITTSLVAAENRLTPGVSYYCLAADTVWVGVIYTLEFSIENDALLKKLSLGFRIYSPDGATWEWRPDENGYGPDGWNTGLRSAQVEHGCRMDPAELVWDVSDLRIIEQDMDGNLPDRFLIFGEADTAGLEPGSAELMISMGFRVAGPSGPEVKTICIDSVFIPPDGDWLFVDDLLQTIVPEFGWGDPICWPVKLLPNCCPWPWAVCPSGPMEIGHCGSGDFHLEVYNYTEDPFSVYPQCHNGSGTTSILQDGSNIIVTYTAAESDCGNTVDILMKYMDPWNPCSEICLDQCILHAVITNNAPTLSVGLVNNTAGEDNMFIKADIAGLDSDTCDELTYTMVNGSGDLDPETGVYTWIPSPDDAGTHLVEISVTDGYDTVVKSFTVDVIPNEGFKLLERAPGSPGASATVSVAGNSLPVVRARISTRSAESGRPTSILNRNRSTCASGNG